MRQLKPINAGSMADIAFLLLIFWLVATAIKPEKGVSDILKSEDDKVKIAVPTKDSDIMRIYVTEDGEYEVEGETLSLELLEQDLLSLLASSGYRAKVIISAHYDAPYKEYILLLKTTRTLNLNTIEKEIKEETEPGD